MAKRKYIAYVDRTDRKFQRYKLDFPTGIAYVDPDAAQDMFNVLVEFHDGMIGSNMVPAPWGARTTVEALPSIIGMVRTIILAKDRPDLIPYIRRSERGSRIRLECHYTVDNFSITHRTNGSCWRVQSSYSVYRYPKKVERDDELRGTNIKFNGHNYIGDDADWVIAIADLGVPGILRTALDVRKVIGRVNRVVIKGEPL